MVFYSLSAYVDMLERKPRRRRAAAAAAAETTDCKTLPLCSSPCLSYVCVRVQYNSTRFARAVSVCARATKLTLHALNLVACDQSLRVHVCLVARGWERGNARILSFVNCDLILI